MAVLVDLVSPVDLLADLADPAHLLAHPAHLLADAAQPAGLVGAPRAPSRALTTVSALGSTSDGGGGGAVSEGLVQDERAKSAPTSALEAAERSLRWGWCLSKLIWTTRAS